MNFLQGVWASFSQNPALENTAIDGTFSANVGTNTAINGIFSAKASHTVSATRFPHRTNGVQKSTSVVRTFFLWWVDLSYGRIHSFSEGFCFIFSIGFTFLALFFFSHSFWFTDIQYFQSNISLSKCWIINRQNSNLRRFGLATDIWRP